MAPGTCNISVDYICVTFAVVFVVFMNYILNILY